MADTNRRLTDDRDVGLLLFHEYFHGDTGTGLGASHQTGWTGLVADLVINAYRLGSTGGQWGKGRTEPQVMGSNQRRYRDKQGRCAAWRRFTGVSPAVRLA